MVLTHQVQAEVQADAWCLCRLTHGFIRTAHAVRSCALTAGPSAHQIDELAHGLAYWAARYGFTHGITVIVDPTDLRWGDSTLTEAIARIPRPPGGINGRIPPPLAVQRFGEILPSAELRAATGMIAKPDDVDTALSQLTAQFSGVFLARDEGIPGTIAHVVTVPAALRLVLPHLPAELHLQSYATLWQLAALLTAVFTTSNTGEGPGRVFEEELLPRDRLSHRVRDARSPRTRSASGETATFAMRPEYRDKPSFEVSRDD